MEKILLLTLVISTCLSSTSETFFTGRIVYKSTFLAPDGSDITPQMSKVLGKQQDYYINDKNYKSILNGTAMKMQIYHGESNKYHIVLPNNSTQVIDASVQSEKVEQILHSEEEIMLLGEKCKKLVIKTNQSEMTYFYAPSMKVPVENFKGHIYGSWYAYLKASKGALPLKSILKNSSFTCILEAVKIEEKELTDADFSIPTTK